MRYVSNVDKIISQINKACEEALAETAEYILMLIRLFAPVLTGELRDSYSIHQVNALHFLIGTALYRALYSEFGTIYQSGTPHVTPAFHQAESFLQTKIAEKLKEKLR